MGSGLGYRDFCLPRPDAAYSVGEPFPSQGESRSLPLTSSSLLGNQSTVVCSVTNAVLECWVAGPVCCSNPSSFGVAALPSGTRKAGEMGGRKIHPGLAPLWASFTRLAVFKADSLMGTCLELFQPLHPSSPPAGPSPTLASSRHFTLLGALESEAPPPAFLVLGWLASVAGLPAMVQGVAT